MSTDPKPAANQPHDVENLDSHECWRLLRSVTVGRMAVWVDDHPDIFPINYKVDHGTLVFRTAEGTKLHAATGDTPVALEADGVNSDSGVAWSVVVKGQAAAVKNEAAVQDRSAADLVDAAGRRHPLRPRIDRERIDRATPAGPAQARRVISTVTARADPPPPDKMPFSGGTSR